MSGDAAGGTGKRRLRSSLLWRCALALDRFPRPASRAKSVARLAHAFGRSISYVHFTPPTEGLARRIAADAERAYAELSKELHPPRGMIDVVISDDVDVSNGSATPYPDESHRRSTRIRRCRNRRFATRMTGDSSSSRTSSRTSSISIARAASGRSASTCSAAPRRSSQTSIDPSWLTEGLAVYEESKIAGAGRIEGSEHRMIARAAAIDHTLSVDRRDQSRARTVSVRRIGVRLRLAVRRLPRASRRASRTSATFVDKSAATSDSVSHRHSGQAERSAITFSRGVAQLHRFRRVARFASTPAAPLAGWRELTRDGVFVFAPRWLSDSAIVYSGTPGRESFGAFRVGLDGTRTRIGRRNSRSANVPLGDGSLLYCAARLHRSVQAALRPLDSARQARTAADVRPATHQPRRARRRRDRRRADHSWRDAPRARVARRQTRSRRSPSGSYDEQWTEPRWSHAGDYIVASRWLRGNIVADRHPRHDSAASFTRYRAERRSRRRRAGCATIAGILYSSDRTGSAQLYVKRFTRTRATSPSRARSALSDVETGLFEPNAAPRDTRTVRRALSRRRLPPRRRRRAAPTGSMAQTTTRARRRRIVRHVRARASRHSSSTASAASTVQPVAHAGPALLAAEDRRWHRRRLSHRRDARAGST